MSELVLKNSDLSKGWKIKTVKELFYIKGRIGWRGLKKSDFTKEGPYLITGVNIKNGKVDWEQCYRIPIEKFLESPEIIIQNDDILLTKDGTIGKVAYVKNTPDQQASLNAHLFLIRNFENNGVYPLYLYYLLHSPYFLIYVKKNQIGTTRPSLTQRTFEKLPIPLPPLNEQKRIVDKIEELFSLIDSTTELLEKTKILLKQYQQSITTLIFEGKLIPQDPNDESISLFLEKIIQEKSSKPNTHAKLSLNDLVLDGNNLPKDLINVKLNDIPETWKIVELQQISEISDSLHITPKYSFEGIPMVRVTDVKPGFLDLTKTKKVTKDIFKEFTKKYVPKKNDIIMTRVGSYGIFSFVNTDEPFCLGQNTVVINSPFTNFLYYFFNSTMIKDQIEKNVVGSTQKTISLKHIRELNILLPPLNEQTRIVIKIEKINSLIQNGEIQVDSLLLQNNLMKNSILKQAFEGKLVPQDPNDEPAEILLQKIKQEKEQLIQLQKSKMRKKNVK